MKTILPPPPSDDAAAPPAATIPLDDDDLEVVEAPRHAPRLSKPKVLARWDELDSTPPSALSLFPPPPTVVTPLEAPRRSGAVVPRRRAALGLVATAALSVAATLVLVPRATHEPAVAPAAKAIAPQAREEVPATEPTTNHVAPAIAETVAAPRATTEAQRADDGATETVVATKPVKAARSTERDDVRTKVAVADVAPEPNETPAPEAPKPEPKPFDASAARTAITSAASAAASCGTDDASGTVLVAVTFAASGRVTRANVQQNGLGPSVGSCVARSFYGLTIPPFDGDPITVTKHVAVHAR